MIAHVIHIYTNTRGNSVLLLSKIKSIFDENLRIYFASSVYRRLFNQRSEEIFQGWYFRYTRTVHHDCFVFDRRNLAIRNTLIRFLLRYHVRNRTFLTSRSLDRKRKSKKSKVGRKMKTARMPEPARSLEQPIFKKQFLTRVCSARGEQRRPKAETLSRLYGRWFDRAVRRTQRVSQDGNPT